MQLRDNTSLSYDPKMMLPGAVRMSSSGEFVFCDLNESLSCHIKQALEILFGERGQPSVAHPFSAEYGLVIGQLACEEKSNEIWLCS